MLNTLKGWISNNTVTSDPHDKILIPAPAGNVDLDQIYEEMLNEDTGLRKETIVHVTTLFLRIIARLLMNGYNVNTGLFHAVARFTGVIEGGKWDSQKNGVYVSFVQDLMLSREIANTKIEILGDKKDVLYIIEVEDRQTGKKDGTVTAGNNIFVRGSYLKVVGEHADVGVYLVSSDNSSTKLPEVNLTVNKPSELVLLIPADTTAGQYELKITTQYTGGGTLLKEPRSITFPVIIGGSSSGGGGDDGGGEDVLG